MANSGPRLALFVFARIGGLFALQGLVFRLDETVEGSGELLVIGCGGLWVDLVQQSDNPVEGLTECPQGM